jgi:ankyrin repeat protein
MASSGTLSGVNPDGSLKKYEKPIPTTVASVSAANGDVAQLSTLSRKDLLAIDDVGNTPLIWSADRGHKDAVELLLSVVESDDPTSVNTRGFLGNTALARAARGGHVDCVLTLLTMSSQINPNIANEKLQYPLHFAAFKRHREVVKLLLDSKLCDTMVTDRKGRTAAEDTSDEVIRNLILDSR